ncbi:hypothetical protein CHS0354_002652 [Potamilus streckersoni]|uniref:Uncharacterized protein n=1 Tax=Potamilus streckersoni TaxID=2493646 RepID=A0AAE0SI61_9BIVA|nr:hypothetical protein CHS0354_002652 [Potamilus streckersoni]
MGLYALIPNSKTGVARGYSHSDTNRIERVTLATQRLEADEPRSEVAPVGVRLNAMSRYWQFIYGRFDSSENTEIVRSISGQEGNIYRLPDQFNHKSRSQPKT